MTRRDCSPQDRVWLNGALVPITEASVPILNPTLHYGWGVFEGIRSHTANGGAFVFRLADHMARLKRSAHIYHMAVSWSTERLCEAALEVIKANGSPACYIRPLVLLGSEATMGIDHLGAPVNVVIASWQWRDYLGEGAEQHGIRAICSSWQHIGPSTIPPAAKGTGQYVNASLAKAEAKLGGYDEALLLNAAGNVVQGSAENIFAVIGRRVITPPLSEGILNGVTRQSVLALSEHLGFEVDQTPLHRTDLYIADEVFLTGTAAGVVPVVEVDGRPIGPGVPGTVTPKLSEAYKHATEGRLNGFTDWCTPI